ncbi:MAG: gamma-glutamyl-gamma-aminobutyrate hydrolase family protein [Fimbriimonadaceae bacterium]|nr:gamma-glutamyl-gamma-aminobutyrate hydrolase family protein [Chthonomonadaceae bacterium]MCO5298266.1 gamma-glutamyl-gamma-aminobutyrate hydrolase family protein [Fimbriimonadaceae bacterium]
MKPIIGITVECRHEPENGRSRGTLSLNWNYAERVAAAGGVPLLIPPQAEMAEIAPLLDGWLIPGGYDIDGREFGQPTHPKAELQDPARFAGEKALFHALAAEVPILGICYGCQFLNVVRGGGIVQHIPDLVGHEGHAGGNPGTCPIETDSLLHSIVRVEHVTGLSFHHQACGDPGAGLRVVARAEDGVVEAIEADDRPWLVGVQWHPERTPEDPATQRLFASFVDAARRFRATRQGPVGAL